MKFLDLNTQKQLLDDLNKYALLIGVIDETNERENEEQSNKRKGVNNAELLFIHENGSPLRNLPRRPILQYTLEWANLQLPTVLDECIEGILNGWSRKQLELRLNQFGSNVAEHARDLIANRDPRLAPNKPSTIKGKKSDLPLFDTGELSRSITFKLIKM